ncbi:MAG: hypothetical protein F6K37_20990 [Moorea sp. SIO4E2]|uniref:hypothetical protein n=1 Tax=Moorena sp. SIO4E2 TaxID=2607826 RepID=UPI0013B69ABD|nr:hypothetical protein [Moorena sp. SIO4E2]NEQ08331.1 hypothetical protein [Moorena sp. SIO4E2]
MSKKFRCVCPGSSHDSPEAQERDRKKQARLESLGVGLKRFRELEVCSENETAPHPTPHTPLPTPHSPKPLRTAIKWHNCLMPK